MRLISLSRHADPGRGHPRRWLRTRRWSAVAVIAIAAAIIAVLSPVAATADAQATAAAPTTTASTAAAGTSGTGLTTDTFESDPVGSVPAGCITPAGRAPATVSDQEAYQGSKSLQVDDTSPTSLVVINCPEPAQEGAYMSFEMYPAALAHGVDVDLDGTAQDYPAGLGGGNPAVFHLLVSPDGSIQWYDGSGWDPLAPAGTVPMGQWSQVQLVASADDSTVYVTVNGTYVGSGEADTLIGALTGYGFDSSGTAYVGDEAYFDNVSYGPLSAIPAGTPATDGFESDAVGSVPAGCATMPGRSAATVSDQEAYQGSNSLQLDHTSGTAQVGVYCLGTPQEGAYLSFEVDPVALPNGFGFDIDGDTLASTGLSPSVFHFAVFADGSISWDDGSTFRPLAPAGTVPVGQWSQIEVSVPSDNSAAYVAVNGTYVGSAGPTIGDNGGSYNEVTAITGYGFDSYADYAVGDDVFVDNVTFGDAADTPASVTTPPVQVGAKSEIDDVGQVQLPTSDLVVPNPDGKGTRILAEYPAHSDSDVTTGNRLAYSDDGGVTWVSDQAANPMPDVPSFFMTRLRNGDILAVNYHTYMTPGSDTEAEVDTAISTDDGQTWTVRTGTMTTPEPMQSLGASERPGSPLGGFVLVHPAVEDPDGTLYQSAYGYYAGDQGYREILLVSHDEGLDWTVQGVVATSTAAEVAAGDEGPCEGALARTANGDLLMVMRVSSYVPMIYSVSTDNGVTWSTPQQVAVGPDAQPLYSVFPTMQQLPDGELVLLTGRPGLVMTVSKDGLGNDWSTPVGIDYVNSENGAFTLTSPSSVLVLGDNGRVYPWQVWARPVTIDQPCAQVITGSYNGPLSAGSGGLCLDDATVSGPVTVSGGGRLIAQGSTIHGPVSTSGASVVSLCGTQVDGPVGISGSTGDVTVGDTTRACDPDTLTGPLSITGTSGQVIVDRTQVTGPVTLTGTTSALAPVLAGITVSGVLSCSQNTVAPTDSGVADTVSGPASGQCAALG